MKTYLFTILLSFVVLTPPVRAQAPPAPAPAGPLRVKALLIEPEGAFITIWLIAGTKLAVRYYETENAVDTVDKRLSDIGALLIYEPKELTAALNLYQSRKYAEAKAKFIEVKERFKPIIQLEDNPATMAAFYEMECCRKLGDYEGLAAALGKFIKEPLSRDWQHRQIELYILWDAVRTKSWERMDLLAKDYIKTPMTGDQRAQIGYCHGLALEGLKKYDEAMFAYQMAITADAGASEELARDGALHILNIFKNDDEVQVAMKLWGTKDENKSGQGYRKLVEANAVAKLFEKTLGAGISLPASLKVFLTYVPKPDTFMEGSDQAGEGDEKSGDPPPPVPSAPDVEKDAGK